jgi:hypothetical protein
MRHARPDLEFSIDTSRAGSLDQPDGVIAEKIAVADLRQQWWQACEITKQRRHQRISYRTTARILHGRGSQALFGEHEVRVGAGHDRVSRQAQIDPRREQHGTGRQRLV